MTQPVNPHGLALEYRNQQINKERKAQRGQHHKREITSIDGHPYPFSVSNTLRLSAHRKRAVTDK